ncbi:MAG: AIR synthase-related protein, partial [Planctomycetota bacterium]
LKARDLGLYTAVTDCGAGGLSSAVGEMGEQLGANVKLETVPVKYQGLTYFEIWLSEAQERMVYSVPAESVEQMLALFAAEDVEATDIGIFTGDGRLKLSWKGEQVCDVEMSFLHDGMPKIWREAVYEGVPERKLPAAQVEANDHAAVLKAILSSYNVASKEWVLRQYDHEVQAGSAIKPLTGPRRDGPSDACAIVPKLDSDDAVVVSNGLNTRYGDVDPYWMALSNIDEALRNYVATGGNIDHCAILDNFSWGNCNKPDRLAAIVRASFGCLTAARAYGTPFISGKDSLNNEFKTESGGSISIPHTLLISAFGKAVSLDALTTSDLKKAGNKLFIMGLTRQELAGSHFEMVTGQPSVNPPKVDPDAALESFRALNAAQGRGLIESAHDCSEGGIAIAVAEMCIAGRVGSTVNLTAELTDDGCEDSALMFAESNSRIVLEVKPENIDALKEAFKGKPLFELGDVGGQTLEIKGMDGSSLLSSPVEELVTAWREPIYKVFGETAPC